MVQARSFSTGPIEVDGLPAPGLHYPTAIAHLRTAEGGNVKLGQKTNGPELVVADASCRLYVINAHGACRKTLGRAGEGVDEFGAQGVSAICLSADGLAAFVVDSNNHRLQKIRYAVKHFYFPF